MGEEEGLLGLSNWGSVETLTEKKTTGDKQGG